LEFPPLGVGDDIEFAGTNAGRWFFSESRLAGSTGISHLFPVIVPYKCDGFLPEDVKFIRADFQNLFRTDLHTLSATIAFVCVQSEIPISGTILKTVIGNHIFPQSPITKSQTLNKFQ